MILDEHQVIEFAEGLDFEAKKAAGRDGQGQLPDSFWDSYSAMANTEGGIVLLGLEETDQCKFAVHGIGNPAKIIKELWDGLNNREKVSVNILANRDVCVLDLQGKKIVQIHIPRATRFQMPVFLGKNPFGHTYRRNFEGDYRCDEETVKRMLADQVEDVRDGKLLENFGFDDLNLPTLQAYRSAFKAVSPTHAWADLDDHEFLRSLGGWTMNRETKREGLTQAGLLMFGKLRSILEAVPHYVVDYQERPHDSTEDADRRWIDRVTTDGAWSGNLYDFYRMAIQRLTRDLKVPFKLKGTTRIDDTPVHEAIREALTNLIIHADFTGRASLYVVKRQDMFGFRNPGLMRVPLHMAVRGGHSDCRNRTLQKMFQLVGLAEQAGSGLPKVFSNWRKQHWRRPELFELLDPDQTILRLRPLSLLPEETLTELDTRFGSRFRELPEAARLALATVAIERSVTHARLKEMCATHPKDLSKILADLVDGGFLVSRGATRGTTYYFADKVPEIFSPMLGIDTLLDREPPMAAAQKPGSSQQTEVSSQQTEVSSQQTEVSSQQTVSPSLSTEELRQLAEPVRKNRRSPKTLVRATIVRLCTGRFLTTQELAKLLNREALTLQTHHLNDLVREGVLRPRHPDKITHPQQAYTSAIKAAD